MQKLGNLLKDLNVKGLFDPELEINGLSYDSRETKPADLFFALIGVKDKGTKYIKDAIDSGAVAIITDIDITEKYDKPILKTDNARLVMCNIAKTFYDHPENKLKLIGITGTNGKTTITFLIENILKTVGINTGVIGTISYRWNNKLVEAKNTTPESVDYYNLLNEMHNSAVEVVVSEVSSHSLNQSRVIGEDYDIAVFTNLTPDHLDYHVTMENYFIAKSKLFIVSQKNNSQRISVINIDDDYGRRLFDLSKKNGLRTLSYSVKTKDSDFFAQKIVLSSKNTSFELVDSINKTTNCVETMLLGTHNIYNILASWVSCKYLGINDDVLLKSIKSFTNVPGRLDAVNLGQNYTVVIDYAHTPDALLNVLTILKKIATKRIITVFGCGGDRDRSKRPVMGNIATELSDFVIVTSDNPRTEDPARILLDIEVGIKRVGSTN